MMKTVPIMLIDTHCHVNDLKAFPNPSLEVEEAKRSGVQRLFVVGIESSQWKRTVGLAEEFEEVFAILGWHPNHAADYKGESLSELREHLAHPKVLALGEIGLDYHWDFATPEQQRVALLDQLALAREVQKPVVFHCREAYPDLLEILEQQPGHPYLFHCFAGTQSDADRAVKLGAYFGVDGPITYKKNGELRAVIAGLPKDRLVVETDSPYLSPEPFRGKPNRPAHVKHVNERLATVLEMDSAATARLTTENAIRFFKCP
jgi:TatD DNase family protein